MKHLCILVLMVLILPIAYPISYYIDEKITISENGDAYIKGTTNVDLLADVHPVNENIDGRTSELTSKKAKYWLFSYDSKSNLSASYIQVSLPKGAVINYIKSSLSINLATNNDIITATFFGENKQAGITIQYSLSKTSSFLLGLIPGLIAVIVVVLAVSLIFLLPKKKIKQKIDENKLSAIKPTLNETQIKIIDALLEKKGEASQTAIMYMTNIPKSSLSRNVEILSQKELIQKFYNGTSNYIKLHPSLRK